MTRPDPLQLPETADTPTRRRRRPRLARGEQAALGGMTFFATVGVGLFTVGMADSWQYLVGVGWGIVLVLVWRWAVGFDA